MWIGLKARRYESDRQRMIKRVIAFLSLEDITVVFAPSAEGCASPSWRFRPALARSSSDNKLSSTSSMPVDDPVGTRGSIRILSKEEETVFLWKSGSGAMSIWLVWSSTTTLALLGLWRKLGRSSEGDLFRKADIRNEVDPRSTVFARRRW